MPFKPFEKTEIKLYDEHGNVLGNSHVVLPELRKPPDMVKDFDNEVYAAFWNPTEPADGE